MRKRKFVSSRRFGISALVFALIMTQGGITLSESIANTYKIKTENIKTEEVSQFFERDLREELNKEKADLRLHKQKSETKTETFKVTAYDLSYSSTQKYKSHPAYGITYTGVSLKGKTAQEAKAISVDPDIIPLGSKVLIEFNDEEHKQWDGIYTSVDIGGGIKNKRIDLFVGDFNSSKMSKVAKSFGVTYAKVTILPSY
jgi:3D (Asp-Asp-Asp) domain-containing protein